MFCVLHALAKNCTGTSVPGLFKRVSATDTEHDITLLEQRLVHKLLHDSAWIAVYRKRRIPAGKI